MKYERGARRSMGAGRQNFAPVKVGDELDVKIEHLGEKGDGIAKKDGFVLFVPGTKQGDEVKIKVTRVLQKVGFAEVVGQSQKSDEEGDYAEKESSEETKEPDMEESKDEQYSGEDSENFGEDEDRNA